MGLLCDADFEGHECLKVFCSTARRQVPMFGVDLEPAGGLAAQPNAVAKGGDEEGGRAVSKLKPEWILIDEGAAAGRWK